MQNNKDKWAKVARVVREIDTCVSNTTKTAYHRGEGPGQPVVVVAALGATGECVYHIRSFAVADVSKCAARMREIHEQGRGRRCIHSLPSEGLDRRRRGRLPVYGQRIARPPQGKRFPEARNCAESDFG